MSLQQELLFDIMESEADVLYFIGDAKQAALIVVSSPVGHFPKRRGDKYTLWFGRGIARWSFKTRKQAEEQAMKILETAVKERPVRIDYPRNPKKNTTITVGPQLREEE